MGSVPVSRFPQGSERAQAVVEYVHTSGPCHRRQQLLLVSQKMIASCQLVHALGHEPRRHGLEVLVADTDNANPRGGNYLRFSVNVPICWKEVGFDAVGSHLLHNRTFGGAQYQNSAVGCLHAATVDHDNIKLTVAVDIRDPRHDPCAVARPSDCLNPLSAAEPVEADHMGA